MEYPLIVEAYELVPDSGGAGQYRGGLGLRRIIRPANHSAVFSGHGERFRTRPWGVFGGGPGAVGRFALIDEEGRETPLRSKPVEVILRDTQAVMVETPGAGGYGPPHDRDRQALDADYRSEKFSGDFLRKHYGFEPPMNLK